MRPTPGLHHVTVVGGDPNRNVAFYTGVLGLRLVKKTINYEDPAIFHFYYECGGGGPGTILTFFLGNAGEKNIAGESRLSAVRLGVARGSMGEWCGRLCDAGVSVVALERFGERVLGVRDPDGTALELDEVDAGAGARGVVGLSGVTLRAADPAATVEFLRRSLGLVVKGAERGCTRLALEASKEGSPRGIDVVLGGEGARGPMGAGAIHHAAFRAVDEVHQAELRNAVAAAGRDVTGVIDRTYFRSVYFHEPGGAKLEIATDGPGFCVDEEAGALGGRLVLPAALEGERGRIERGLVGM